MCYYRVVTHTAIASTCRHVVPLEVRNVNDMAAQAISKSEGVVVGLVAPARPGPKTSFYIVRFRSDQLVCVRGALGYEDIRQWCSVRCVSPCGGREESSSITAQTSARWSRSGDPRTRLARCWGIR